MGKPIVLAADLGGTNLRMAAVNRRGRILFHTKRETPRGESAGEIMRAMVEAAGECRKNCEGFEIESICAAVPATVDAKAGIVVKAPNLPALDNFGIIDALERELGIRARLENDANAAAVGENWLGASKGFANSVLVTLGTGVGGGIIADGKLLRGGDGMAGEIGHICVEPFGAPCGCGARGCVEQYASASAIVRIAEELKIEFPESVLNKTTRLTAAEVFRAGKTGDRASLEVFRQMGFYLGIAFSTLINILNPEIIVITGGASAGWNLFAPHLKKTIRQRDYGGLSKQTKIVRGKLADDAGILGAAMLGMKRRNDEL